ncbi:MAG: glutathione S-transferase family protein [Methylacidiphilales bacterium]|nr:glutathione S-transferase family protein [Candidatus Methylacidiphilales bacterium]
MELYTLPNDPDSLRARLVVYEKEIPCRIIEVDLDSPQKNSDIDLSHFSGVLTLREKNFGTFVFNDSDLMLEYLDERFPCPQLMPNDPLDKARCRFLLKYFRNKWFPLYARLENCEKESKSLFQKEIQLFSQWVTGSNWLFGKELSLADCSAFPYLIKLRSWNISVTPRTPLDRYINKFLTHATILAHFNHEIELMKNSPIKSRKSKR